MSEPDRVRLALAIGMMRAKERIVTEIAPPPSGAPIRRVPLAGAPLARRWRLACECGLVTLPGPLANHQYATGHRDLI